jgi:hypothetical protein
VYWDRGAASPLACRSKMEAKTSGPSKVNSMIQLQEIETRGYANNASNFSRIG